MKIKFFAGSCIATSLIRGETIPKHVAVLKIYKSQFAMQCMKLKTVRPFVYNRINLNQYDNEINNLRTNNSIGRLSRPEAVEHFIDKYIEKVLLPAARKKETGLLFYYFYLKNRKSNKKKQNVYRQLCFRTSETTKEAIIEIKNSLQ